MARIRTFFDEASGPECEHSGFARPRSGVDGKPRIIGKHRFALRRGEAGQKGAVLVSRGHGRHRSHRERQASPGLRGSAR